MLGSLLDKKILQEHRRRTGMIFQQHQLIGRLSVLQNVLMGRLGYHSTLRTLFLYRRRINLLDYTALTALGYFTKHSHEWMS